MKLKTINIHGSYEIIESLDTFKAKGDEPIIVDLCGTGGVFLDFLFQVTVTQVTPKL